MNNLKGFLYGIATSVTFGLIPLFTLPLMAKGLIFDSILFYRFLLATAALGVMMLLKKETFRIQMRDVPVLVLLGLLYTGSAMFLFWGYNFMGAGVATTIHFTYPIFVTLLMFVFFREKASWITWLAILLAVAGVAKLSIKGSELTLDPLGMLIVVLSAVSYASYIIVVNKSRVRSMNGRKLAFLCLYCQYLAFRCQSPVQRRDSVGSRFSFLDKPVPAGCCPYSDFEYYAGSGCSSYRWNADFGTGCHGTGDGCLHRCLCFPGRIYLAVRLRYSIDHYSRNTDYPLEDDSENIIYGSPEDSSAPCLILP